MKKKYSYLNLLKETPKTLAFSTFVWNVTIKEDIFLEFLISI